MKEYKCLSCGKDYSEPELSIFCCSVDPKDAELTKLKSDVERLRTRLKDAEKIIGHAEFHRAIGCVILWQQIQDFKARALEETK